MSGEIDRRTFLQSSLIGAGALLLKPERFNLIPEFDTPKAEIIQGVEVYGTLNPINSKSDLERFIRSLETQSFAKIHGGRRVERSLLPDDKRYWEFIVPKSLYDRFNDAGRYISVNKPRGVNFPSWARLQAKKFNQILEASEPAVPFRIELTRIIVLPDALYPKEAPFWVPDGVGDNFVRYAKDVDSRWAFGPDYYDYQFAPTAPINTQWINYRNTLVAFTGGYSEVIANKEGALTTVDWGLIHELFHHLDIGDLYWLPRELRQGNRLPERFKKYSFFPNDIMSNIWSAHISPASAMAILERASKGVRGVQHEPLGLSDNQYRNFPVQTDFQFNFPDSTQVESISSMGADGLNPLKKETYNGYYLVFNQNSCQDGFDIAYLLVDMRKDGKRSAIPIPRFILNMARWAGNERAKFQITFTGNDLETAQGLSFSVVPSGTFKTIKEDPTLFAFCEIPGTGSWGVWEQY